MEGEELTEMAELREAGAVGFTDDGLPIAQRPGAAPGAPVPAALPAARSPCTRRTRSSPAAGSMHEGAVSAALGLAGMPVGLGVDDDRPRRRARRATRTPGSTSSTSPPRESVEAVARAPRRPGVEITCEATPAPPLTLTDEAVRSLDARFKMNPPLRTEDDRQALIEGLRDGTIDCIATDHAPHAAEEKEVPFEQAAMGVTGLETAFAALYTDLVLPGRDRRSSCWSSG